MRKRNRKFLPEEHRTRMRKKKKKKRRRRRRKKRQAMALKASKPRIHLAGSPTTTLSKVRGNVSGDHLRLNLNFRVRIRKDGKVCLGSYVLIPFFLFHVPKIREMHASSFLKKKDFG